MFLYQKNVWYKAYVISIFVEPESIVSTKPSTQASVSPEAKTRTTGEKRQQHNNTIHLWEFLLELLADDRCSAMISWSRRECGEFVLKNQHEVAKRWGILKQRPGMNYDKLSRALRYYYKQGIVKKVSESGLPKQLFWIFSQYIAL